jgi:CRISPR/Cas system CSM-associated protein Csm3 (group 7 of RAMP superfamily)
MPLKGGRIMEKKRQHYIPQLYLREFLDKSIVDSKWTPTVHIFEWHNNKLKYLRQKAPESICEETNYYSLNDENEIDRLFIENALRETENNYGRIMERWVLNSEYHMRRIIKIYCCRSFVMQQMTNLLIINSKDIKNLFIKVFCMEWRYYGISNDYLCFERNPNFIT